MRIDVLTLFPEMFSGPLDHSIVGRARERGLLDVRLTDIRDFTTDKHRQVDDAPYGGGPGMVMKPEPIFAAVEAVAGEAGGSRGGGRQAHVILLDPQGRRFTQSRAWELAAKEHLVLICGHYEGVDERVRSIVDEELSIGDFVLTGGELPAMVVIDAVCRLLPGAIGEADWPVKIRSRASCWITRTTLGRRSFGACRRPRCCSAATTKRFDAGGGVRRCGGLWSGGLICWPKPLSPRRIAACWRSCGPRTTRDRCRKKDPVIQ